MSEEEFKRLSTKREQSVTMKFLNRYWVATFAEHDLEKSNNILKIATGNTINEKKSLKCGKNIHHQNTDVG